MRIAYKDGQRFVLMILSHHDSVWFPGGRGLGQVRWLHAARFWRCDSPQVGGYEEWICWPSRKSSRAQSVVTLQSFYERPHQHKVDEPADHSVGPGGPVGGPSHPAFQIESDRGPEKEDETHAGEKSGCHSGFLSFHKINKLN